MLFNNFSSIETNLPNRCFSILVMQAVGDLRRRKLLPGKNLQKLKDLQAGNKKKEVRRQRL